jgi:ferredoxin
MIWRASHIRWIVFGLAVLFSLPWPGAPFVGLYLWGSPYLMLNALLSGKSLGWLNLIGLAALGIIFVKTRWICRFACPAGVVCDLGSKWGRKKRGSWKFPVNKYLVLFSFGIALLGFPLLMVLDPFNLFFMAFEGIRTGMGAAALIKLSGLLFLFLFSLIFPHTWCASVCPLGGMQLLAGDLRKVNRRAINNPANRDGRRLFLAGLSGALTGVILLKGWPRRRMAPMRPPFALEDGEMNAACIRCGSCSAACPTNIITQSLDFQHPQRLLTPVVGFKDSYCLPTCNDCGNVCPSGAIQKFAVREKKNHVMGIARIDLERCYLNEGRECNQCRHYCEFDAIEMKAGSFSPRLPRVIEEVCVGCGACQVVCPPQVITIIPQFC